VLGLEESNCVEDALEVRGRRGIQVSMESEGDQVAELHTVALIRSRSLKNGLMDGLDAARQFAVPSGWMCAHAARACGFESQS
jgi:hypothetical protein